MNTQFRYGASANLGNVPIVDGQIIALSDKSGMYYDLNGTRYNVTPLSVSDNYKTSSGTAAERVAASSYGLSSAYTELRNRLDIIGGIVSSDLYTLGVASSAGIYASIAPIWRDLELSELSNPRYSATLFGSFNIGSNTVVDSNSRKILLSWSASAKSFLPMPSSSRYLAVGGVCHISGAYDDDVAGMQIIFNNTGLTLTRPSSGIIPKGMYFFSITYITF